MKEKTGKDGKKEEIYVTTKVDGVTVVSDAEFPITDGEQVDITREIMQQLNSKKIKGGFMIVDVHPDSSFVIKQG